MSHPFLPWIAAGIFALVGAGMAVYGMSSVLFMQYTAWDRR